MIECGNCLQILEGHPAESIDCLITSPPYDGIRNYKGNAGFSSLKLGTEIERILKPGSFAVIVIADQKKAKRLSLTTMRLTLNFVDHAGLSLCDWMIYKRLGRPGAFHSFRRDHESILVFLQRGGASRY